MMMMMKGNEHDENLFVINVDKYEYFFIEKDEPAGKYESWFYYGKCECV